MRLLGMSIVQFGVVHQPEKARHEVDDKQDNDECCRGDVDDAKEIWEGQSNAAEYNANDIQLERLGIPRPSSPVGRKFHLSIFLSSLSFILLNISLISRIVSVNSSRRT